MNPNLAWLQPPTLAQALAALAATPGARALAGGQSLVAAMKLGLAEPTLLVDLSLVPGLREISVAAQPRRCTLGAMLTHSQIAHSAAVQNFCPMVAQLSAGIGDTQIRNRGTIGGSLANNDPAACWPAAALALNAKLHTNARVVAADDWFCGLYTTALQADELLLRVEFEQPLAATYLKWEQKASRFALVGVALARFANGVRVAITGLGAGVVRWREAEAALSADWSAQALAGLRWPLEQAQSDLHASAEYRAHLVALLTQRALARLCGPGGVAPYASDAPNASGTPARVAQEHTPARAMGAGATALKSTPTGPSDTPPGALALSGQRLLPVGPERLWQALLDPVVLQACISGCERFEQQAPNRYQAVVRVGLGPIAARFQAHIRLSDLRAPESCVLHIEAQAALGHAQVQAQMRLSADPTRVQQPQQCWLHWQAQARVGGRIAQLGNRLIEAAAKKMIDDLFARLAQQLQAQSATATAPPTWWRRLAAWWRGLRWWQR